MMIAAGTPDGRKVSRPVRAITDRDALEKLIREINVLPSEVAEAVEELIRESQRQEVWR